jgi:hypothetical protein
VLSQAEQRQVPADADRAGTELVPQIAVVDQGHVLEPQAGPALGVLAQPDVHPAHRTTELPGEGQVGGRVAGGHLARGVALELVAAAQPQVTLDGEEPAGDALAVGDRVPHVVDGRVVGALDHHGASRLTVALQRPHLALLGVDAVDLLLFHDTLI